MAFQIEKVEPIEPTFVDPPRVAASPLLPAWRRRQTRCELNGEAWLA
jgi:hypothetical protein